MGEQLLGNDTGRNVASGINNGRKTVSNTSPR